MKKLVVLGFLGSTLDAGQDAKRWDAWRPTVDLCRHEDLVVHRLELVIQRRFTKLARVIVEDIQSISPETEVRLHELEFDDAWDFGEVYAKTDDFARSLAWNTDEEDYLVHMTTGTHVAQICLFLLVETRLVPGRLLQTSPPKRRGSAPGTYTIIDLDLSKYDRLAKRFQKKHSDALTFLKGGIATRNKAFNALIAQIERVAIASKAPMLLTGPTGAGKSQLARRIHDLKVERGSIRGPFVEVNCATLRGEGAMSALFGHEKGAFTGAANARAGLLRTADGGVLFLDEIGELGADEQAMLLRALEDRRFLPVGSDREVHSDFQLIAGTNRDLRVAVRQRTFREDLLARIDLWTFRLPRLAERTEDIEPNLGFELERWEERHGTRVSFNREARERFLAFACSPAALWTGNFRDFNAALVRMATLCEGGRIGLDVVDGEIARLQAAWRGADDTSEDGPLARHLDSAQIAALDRFDRVQLEDVLTVCEASRSLSDAGRTLFASSLARKASTNDADRLRKYLARFDLDWKEIAKARGAGQPS
jgi:transcriptional regulatory protein RtcR